AAAQTVDHIRYSDSSMEIVTGHVGWIEVISGPMFSGKSEELIRRLRRARFARRRVQGVKPVSDDRYSHDESVSHGESGKKSEPAAGGDCLRSALQSQKTGNGG